MKTSVINIASKQILSNSFKIFLQNALKLSSYQVFVILKVWDVAWVSLIAPWIKAHAASESLHKREKSRAVIMERAQSISRQKPAQDFKKIMSDMWKERAKS